MKKFYSAILLIALVLFIFTSCNKLENKPVLPSITTNPVINLTIVSATCGGNISSQGEVEITQVGVCYNTSPKPTIENYHVVQNSYSANFTFDLSSLQTGTTYYARAFTNTSGGVAYGNEVSFNTWAVTPGVYTDSRDGKIYETVKIGPQTWFAENLAYLPSVNHPNDHSDNSPKYYVYDYIGTDLAIAKASVKYAEYGALYNWAAAMSAPPDGWHLPTNDDWQQLMAMLGGKDLAGGRMKEAGYAHWVSPNIDANNLSLFNALPAGHSQWISTYDYFLSIGYSTAYWSSNGNNWGLQNDDGEFGWDYPNLTKGVSVRCIKN
jgi:uncharacterized protein (TIGR02145 family)